MTDSTRNTNWPQVSNFVTNHHDTYGFIAPSKADLLGKSVLITGASKGVGRTAAIRFAQAGCSKIAIAARSSLEALVDEVKREAQQSKRPTPQVLALQVDVTSDDSVRAAAEAVEDAFGGVLDILINNAGYMEAWAPVVASNPVEWWKSWETNVKGTYMCCHYLLPMVLKSDTKVLINLTSAGGHHLTHGASAYQTARFAMCRFTEHVERENREKGLVAISLHPGSIKTDLALNMPEFMHAILIDELELPADTMVWLGSQKPVWLSGRFVSSNWDLEELEGKKDDIVQRDLLKFRMIV